jgi:trans-2,3-dihydro-3-hydroxyanthranilate isomerase
MLAPELGVPEDPATGSASATFANIINAYDGLTDGTHKRLLEQGLEMGRPSAVTLTMTVSRGKLDAVRIGGHAVRVAEGSIRV